MKKIKTIKDLIEYFEGMGEIKFNNQPCEKFMPDSWNSHQCPICHGWRVNCKSGWVACKIREITGRKHK